MNPQLAPPPEDMPSNRSALFFERAKDLNLAGGTSSIEQERILRDLFKAASFLPDHIPHYMFLGKVFRQALDITSAIFCYRLVLNLQATNLQARKQLSELLVVRGQELMITAAKVKSTLKFHSARACFDEALEVNKEDTEAWICKSVCHIHTGELTEAFEAINRAIKTPRPTTAEMYILRAKIYWGRGLTEQGNVDIRVAAMMDNTHPEVVSFFNRSFLKAEKLYKESVREFTNGNYKEALLSVNHAMHITTEDVKLLIMQSKIHRMLGELQAAYDSMLRAKTIFEKAFEGTCYPMELPADIVLQINLILNDMSIDYASKGNYTKAILLLNKVIKTEESLSHGGLVKVNHRYLVNRGDCHRALNSLADAVYDYNLALKIMPDDWEIKTRLSLTHYLIATVYFNQSQFRETQFELDKAIKFNPKVSEYYSVRGRTHYFQSNFQQAYADFKKSLELNEDNAEVKEWLSQFDDEERGAVQNTSSQSSGGGGFGGTKPKKSMRRIDFTKVSHTKETHVVRKLEVTSEDSKGLVAWLSACEMVNLGVIEVTTVSNQMGWQDEALTTFLWGREAIGEQKIQYLGADGGGEGLADAFRARGTLAEWQQAVAPVAEHPHVLMALYVSLCAPFLAILDAPAWVLDLCGPTSRGKTSALHVAASVWGQPDPGRDPSACRTWDLTVIGAERTCAALGTLPLMLDDTSRARPNDIATVVYTAAQGQGRTRGTPDGTARVGRWRLPMISTGEAPLRSFGTAGGRTARTMTLWGQPWRGGAVGGVVRSVVAGMRAHHGHAGPALLRYLLDKRDTWPGLREMYRLARDRWVALAPGPTAERLAEYVACVDVCIHVVDQAALVPWQLPVGLLESLWSTLAAEVHDAHGAEEALAAVYGIAVAQRVSYWSLVGDDKIQPHGGWLGRWDRTEDWKFVGFLPQTLRKHLEDLGYPYDATVRAWADKGWLERDGKNMTRHVRFGDFKARLVYVKRSAFDEVEPELA